MERRACRNAFFDYDMAHVLIFVLKILVGEDVAEERDFRENCLGDYGKNDAGWNSNEWVVPLCMRIAERDRQ